MRQGRGGAQLAWLLGALGLLMAAGSLIPASAAAALEHPLLESFGAAVQPQPSFTEAEGLAVVQSSGDLLVIDAGNREPGEGTVSRFKPNGEADPFSALGSNVIEGEGEGLQFTFPEEAQVSVDESGGPAGGDIYVTQPAQGLIDIFGEDGSPLGELKEYDEGPAGEGAPKPLGSACGVAVDPAGNLYVGSFGEIHKYEPSANPPTSGDNSANFPFVRGCTVAAGAGPSEGFIFPALIAPRESVAKLDADTGAEKYEVDQGPTTTETVDPGSGHLFTATGKAVKELDVSGSAEATELTPIEAPEGREGEVTGIAVNETSGDVYVARQGNPQIEVWGPAAEPPEAITEAASVIGGTVTLRGTVSAAGGPPTTCLFEYVEAEAKGFAGAQTAPCVPGGPFTGTEQVGVSAQISPPEGAYRFRLVATNEADFSKAGKALFFNTFEAAPGLPDGRAYELVSPPRKIGEVIPPEAKGILGGSCEVCLPGNNSNEMPMQSAPDGESVLYMGQPFAEGLAPGANEYVGGRGAGGWATQGLSTPLMTGEWEAFSADFSRGVLVQGNPALSPEAPVRGGKSFGNLYLVQGGVAQPLVTTEPPHRGPADFSIRYGDANSGEGLSPAFAHIAFAADDALTGPTAAAPAAPEVGATHTCTSQGENCDLYEWTEGELRLLNVLPGNAAAASHSVLGAGQLLGLTVITPEGPDVSHAISADGSRIFWSAEETGQVYARVGGTETVPVQGPASCKASEVQRACFLTASADGSRVLLANGQLDELNEEAGVSEEEEAYEEAFDLTEGQEGFQGILGASEDLSRVYFIDTKALSGSEENANEETAEEGEDNLYAWEEGALRFIGRLAPGDNGFGTPVFFGAWAASPSHRTAQVSADGEYLAFMSKARLTPYDNAAAREVFEYSLASGKLRCASCNPSGQQPIGSSNLSLVFPFKEGPPFPQPHNLTPSGRLFFESRDTLARGDVNGNIQDVYEWEPPKGPEAPRDDSCERPKGCVSLISTGHSPNDSMFLDSAEDGADAFFISREQLVSQDKNQQLDLYDARAPHTTGEAVGFPENGSAPCGGEGCTGPLAPPPSQPSAGSAEFSGPGNPPKPKPKPKKHHHHKAHHKRATPNNRGPPR